MCVILNNLSGEDLVIKDDERIGQMVIVKHEKAEWIKVNALKETSRRTAGFGHTDR